MAEGKYGRLFTEADVRRFFAETTDGYMAESDEEDLVRNLADFEGTFPADEPLFLLRGENALAPDVMREYAIRADDPFAVPEAHRVAAYEAADRMREWQAQNPDRVKVPD